MVDNATRRVSDKAVSSGAKILLVLISISVFLLFGTGRVVKNYSGHVGLAADSRTTYEDVFKQFGEPDIIEILEESPWENEKNMYVISTTYDHPVYGKLKLNYIEYAHAPFDEQNSWELTTITTYNPEHRFGWHRIHVGSTREEVVRAYNRATPVKGIPLGDRYFEGDWLDWQEVTFTYDENDIVTSIQFIAGM